MTDNNMDCAGLMKRIDEKMEKGANVKLARCCVGQLVSSSGSRGAGRKLIKKQGLNIQKDNRTIDVLVMDRFQFAFNG